MSLQRDWTDCLSGKSVSVSAHGCTVSLPKTPPNPPRAKSNFVSRFNVIWAVQIAHRKYSASHFPQISSMFTPSRLIEEGRTRRHDTWSAGCGGRDSVARARHCRAVSGFVLGLVSN